MPNSERILVRGPNWIGDHVMARGFYEGLRSIYPGARLTLLVPESVAALHFPEYFADVIVLPPEARRFPLGTYRFARQLASRRFEVAITLPASFSSAFLLFSAGIPERLGFYSDFSFLLTRAKLWRGRAGGRHKAEQYRELLTWMAGDALPAAPPPSPSPSPPGAEISTEAVILIAPGASIVLRQWPYFRELMLCLLREFPDYRLRVVGGPGEAEWTTWLRDPELKEVEDLVGKTSLPQLVDLCRKARLVIANDSGVAHVAATLAGASTLVIFGPGDPDYIRPLGPRVSEARLAGLPCSPCEKAVCRAPYGYQKCLRDLPVEGLMEKVREAL